MAIVTLVLWVITAGAGVSLLGTGSAARRLAARARAAAGTPDGDPQTAGPPPRAGGSAAAPAVAAVRTAAVPRTAEGKPPPVPRVRVAAPPGERPLLEFSHPALALAGLACWFMFVLVHYRPMAWISFGILLATMALGLTWLSRNSRDARRHVTGAWQFPPRLIAAHGLAAATSIALTVLTALTASRG